MLENYPTNIQSRYALEKLPNGEIELLEAIARKRGCIVSGGVVDFEKVSRIVVSDLRSRGFDGICMETPTQIIKELAELDGLRALKLERAQEKRSKRKGR
jgi:ribosome biogenesis GTPase A